MGQMSTSGTEVRNADDAEAVLKSLQSLDEVCTEPLTYSVAINYGCIITLITRFVMIPVG